MSEAGCRTRDMVTLCGVFKHVLYSTRTQEMSRVRLIIN